MKWFYDVFLPSIFERCGAENDKWLSRKQTAICTEHMRCKTICFDTDGFGTMGKHDNYTCEWNGRQVVLSYSKLNGCGLIRFGCSDAEKAIHAAEAEAEKQRIKAAAVERIKRKPERLEREIARLSDQLEHFRISYESAVEDGNREYAKFILSQIELTEKELALYTA